MLLIALKPRGMASLAERGIRHVGLKVSDMEGSRKFYGEVFGLASRTKESGVVFIRFGPDLLVLYQKGSGGSDFHFGLQVGTRAAVDAWRDRLRNVGVPIHEDITEKGHPRSFKIKDPDGYWIEIASER